MCTSFAVYTTRPFFGMNFDFPDVELKFIFSPAEVGDVFYLSFEWDGTYRRTAGMNTAGLFSAAQMLIAHFDIVPSPAEATIAPYEIFSSAMQTGRGVPDVLGILGDRRVSYTTARKGHQLYADINGHTCIVEPGPNGNRVYPSDDSFTVMTNSPTEREKTWAAENMARLGLDRYRIAQQYILEKIDRFSIEDGFDLLSQTSLTRGRFTTQCSLVCDPREGEIYLALKRDFSKIWKLSMASRTAEAYSGLQNKRVDSISAGGITSAELQELARVA